MINPKLSVIMSVYNDEKYLSEAIESILDQTFRDYEFLIVNDGSNDSSLEIINSYAASDSRISLIDQKNTGLTKALNTLIKLSRGEFIARMDADDISHPDRFVSQINFLTSHPEHALVGCNVIKINENSQEIEKNITKYNYESIKKTLKQRNCIAHGSVMFNKILLGDLLEYNEVFEYSQDYQLWTKIAKVLKLANLPDYLYYLRLHNVSISETKVEAQSIYAGIVAYEFDTNQKLKDFKSELEHNLSLRKKIGLSLLYKNKLQLAKNYFSIFSPYYYISYIFQLLNPFRIKKYFKWLV